MACGSLDHTSIDVTESDDVDFVARFTALTMFTGAAIIFYDYTDPVVGNVFFSSSVGYISSLAGVSIGCSFSSPDGNENIVCSVMRK